jgi:hypothetical protein
MQHCITIACHTVDEREYKKLKEEALAEYKRKLSAIETVWAMSNSSAETTRQDLSVSEMVREALPQFDHRGFNVWEMKQAVENIHTELKGRLRINTLSGTLTRMTQRGTGIRSVKKGSGPIPTKRKQAWPLDGTAEAIEAAARKYVGFGRATAALWAASRAFDRISHQTLLEMLDRAVDEINSSPAQASNMLVYELGRVFDALDRRPEAPKIEIARREYAYLALLQYGDRNLTLHSMMAADPEFFVSILCDVFKPASGDLPEPDEIGRRRATAGYSLLSKFSIVPGKVGGGLDSNVLSKWVTKVRELSAKDDRARIADEYVGHTLAHAPNDEDGGWPHCAVRDLIEALKSDDVESGIKVERLNMRGAFTKAMYEGGKQESGLAEEARVWAKAAGSWPRTHAMLLDLARIWKAKAEGEDQRAQQDKMRFE